LARRFIEDHPMALALEQDVVRGLLGGWVSRETESGLLARELCLAMAETHLSGGHDVIVPQFAAKAGYLDQLGDIASRVGARHVELVLWADAEDAERRFHARLDDPLWEEHQRVAARFIEEAGGYRGQYERLSASVADRRTVQISSVEGDVAGTYAALLAHLDG
jgi:hypothetical protein